MSNAHSANPKRTWLRPATLTILCLVLVVAIYVVAVRFAIPPIVERTLAQYAASRPGRSASIERVSVQPFALRIELANVNVNDDEARISIMAPTVLLDFALSSLLERRAVLDSVTVERPVLRIESPARLDDVRWLLTQARLERLEIREGRLDLVDRTAERDRRLGLDRVALVATGIDARATPTAGPSGRYTLSASDASGMEIHIDGSVAPGLTNAQGPFAITDVDLETIRPWLDTRLRALSLRGHVAVDGEYAISAATWPAVEIRGAGVEIHELSLVPIRDRLVQTSGQSFRANGVLSPTQGIRTFRIDLEGADFELIDSRISPAQTFAFTGVTGSLTPSSDSADQVDIELQGRLDGAGNAWFRADAVPLGMSSPRVPGAVAVGVDALTATTLNPYVDAVIGRELRAGELEIELGYSQRGQRVDGDLHLVTRGLAFMQPDTGSPSIGEDRSGRRLQTDFAAALLEDPEGIIDVEIGFAAAAGADIGAAAANALRRRIAALEAEPFRELGGGLSVDLLRAIVFEPGTAALGERANASIEALAAALERRPRLGLRVRAGYAAQSDRDALARQQIELHVLLATAGPSPQARPEPVDFGSPRAQDVLDEFANERLPTARLTAIADGLGCNRDDESCRTAYYAAVFDALVSNEPIAEATLSRLGRFRAQSIVSALAGHGIAAERLMVARGEAVAMARGVGLPVEVYVFDQSPNTRSPSR